MGCLFSGNYFMIIINEQVLLTSFEWKHCTDLPVDLRRCRGTTTVIDGKVYYGGGASYYERDQDHYIVCCYDPPQNKWTTLPPLPAAVRQFGLGQVNDKLVTVGGKEEHDKITLATDKVYIYDEQLQIWSLSTPMTMARYSPGILSLKSALIVAGGATITKKTNFFGRTSYVPTELNVVELFKLDLLQWHQMNPLPRACCDISLVSINNTCYALGGSVFSQEASADYEITLDQALYAPIDDLFCSTSQSVWKRLPGKSPYFKSKPAAAVLDGNLLAIVEESDFESSAWLERQPKGLYMYNSSKNTWVCIGSPPATSCSSRVDLAVSVLSSLEIIVINHDSKRVHRGIPLFFE